MANLGQEGYIEDKQNRAYETAAYETQSKEESGKYFDIDDEYQTVIGSKDGDTFVIRGESDDYNWIPTEDQLGTVVWNSQGHDLLYDIEFIEFDDETIEIDEQPESPGPEEQDEPDSDDSDEDEESDDTDEEDGEDDNEDDEANGSDRPNYYSNVAGQTQFIYGDESHNTFYIDSDVAGYSWGPTQDGEGIVDRKSVV